MTGFVSPKRESPPLRARRRAAMAAELIAIISKPAASL
jgi:hypothetical protein